jgi:putative zinc finger/helix-turn-helix YgiT family protein
MVVESLTICTHEYIQIVEFDMICFKCNSEEFDVLEASVCQEFRGERFEVRVPVSICKACGWQTFAPGQVDALRKQTIKEYQRKHGLLTSTEIMNRRKALRMSQQAFSKFIGVGVASVKRWERGFVQEPIYDKRIRERCDFNKLQFTARETFRVSERTVLIYNNCSISNGWIFAGSSYTSSPVVIQSNFSRLTSRLSGDAVLAEASKSHRKKHAEFCDCGVSS